MDRDFMFGSASQPGPRPGDPTWDEAMRLAPTRDQLIERLFPARPSYVADVAYDRDARWRHWRWWVDEKTAGEVASGRAWTERGARRRMDRARTALVRRADS